MAEHHVGRPGGRSSRSARSVRSPWTPVTRSATPASSARRPSAASASGLGSTTVTAWPCWASRTANPPVPPPMSTTRASGWRRAATASQTTPVRTAAPALAGRHGAQPRGTGVGRSSGASRAAVPQLARDLLDGLARRLDVGVGRHLEAAGCTSTRLRTGAGLSPVLAPVLAPGCQLPTARRRRRRSPRAPGRGGRAPRPCRGRARSRAAPAAPRRRWRAGRRRGGRYGASSPRTTSSQEPNTVAAYGPWASSKNVASTGPVPSSRVRKTTRRPDRIGGVWVATLTPATSSSALLRRWRRS